jgi:hypothetical protein
MQCEDGTGKMPNPWSEEEEEEEEAHSLVLIIIIIIIWDCRQIKQIIIKVNWYMGLFPKGKSARGLSCSPFDTIHCYL